MGRKFSVALLVILFVAGSTAALSQAQATTGTLQGYLKDESGAVIPGVEVSVRHVETGLTRDVLSDSSGFYRAGSLPSGGYEITASQPGFTRVRRTGIVLSLGQALDIDISLNIAAAGQEISVEATSPLLEITKTEVSSVIDERTIDELPINGRRFTDFALLTPGVTQDPRGLSGASNGDLSFGGSSRN